MDKISEVTTRNELADFLRVKKNTLTHILYIEGVENLYTSFEIPKKTGGMRKINAPHEKLKIIQKKLVDALWQVQKDSRASNETKAKISHAFEKNKSIFTNASRHRNKRFLLNVDLEDFFDSFHFGRVRGFFIKNKYFQLSEEVATVVAQLTCYQGKLPQGAPSSPIITNLICNIMDNRILKIARAFKVDYTRYADDLTFSTNWKSFPEERERFLQELEKEVNKAGFTINHNKTRFVHRDSCQEVTGLVVNERISIKRSYYKETRAMAHELYETGAFHIGEEEGTLNQLEGRFAFINQAEKYNNEKDSIPHDYRTLNAREKQYKQFLFYKYFYANPKPLMVTEGKTDPIYLKAALKNLHSEYPSLVSKKRDEKFEFKISFLNRTNRLRYFFDISKGGGDAFINLSNCFTDKKKNKEYPNYLKILRKNGTYPQNITMLLFDNEFSDKTKHPALNFSNAKLEKDQKEEWTKNEVFRLVDCLYLMITPAVEGKKNCDIEDLFDEKILKTTIRGKEFSKEDDYNKSTHYGKNSFSKYIMQNYKTIDFSKFKPLFDHMVESIDEYEELVREK